MSIQILNFLIKLSIKIVKYFSRHGKTPIKFILWIDDFIRLFSITIILNLLSLLFKLNTFWTIFFFILGVIIDIHDFITGGTIGRFDPD